MPTDLLAINIECSCWEQPKHQPPGEKNEIIEIGVAKFSLKTLEIQEPVSILVKPSVSKISKFCSNITKLTQEQVDTGLTFEEACGKLVKEFDSQKIPWVCWGEFDKKQFLWQCNDFKVSYCFGAGNWDFKQTFAKLMGLDKEVSIKEAMQLLNLEYDDNQSKGKWDALYIAKIMAECFRRIRCISS